MLHNIPIELQKEIIIKLPLKSLIQCRSVSKAFKSLIDSSEFIADHSLRQTQPERLLVRYQDPQTSEVRYVSIIDDETFPHQRSVPTLPPLAEQLEDLRVVGSSHGLVCLYGLYRQPDHPPCYKAVLWNPTIRKSISIVIPNVLGRTETFLGFGVCPVNREPKLVKIASSWCGICEDSERWEVMPWKIEVYALSSGEWRSLSKLRFIHRYIHCTWSHVVIDKFIYWVAMYMVFIDDGDLKFYNMILSFYTANESIGVIDLPESLLQQPERWMSVSRLRESLTVLEFRPRPNNATQVFDIWVMDHGVQMSFTKLFTIEGPHVSIRATLGFRKSGEPIIEKRDTNAYLFTPTALAVYEPTSEHINDLEIHGAKFSFSVNSYVETLLLLNR